MSTSDGATQPGRKANAALIKMWEQAEKLTDEEQFWRDLCPWLLEQGFQLRRRYRPDWVPSWRALHKYPTLFEDSVRLKGRLFIDATEVSSGNQVGLKAVSREKHPDEVPILQLLAESLVDGDQRNHTVPLHKVLKHPSNPDYDIIVMPHLRPYYDPEFFSVAEGIDFLRQAIQGLQYMHHRRIAHRDVSTLNIMMDGNNLFPEGFHPVRSRFNREYTGLAPFLTRTTCAPRYFFTDFGHAMKFSDDESQPRALPLFGGDHTVPEYHNSYDTPCDPFAVDIYCLGNLIREDFQGQDDITNVKSGSFGFMRPLVENMCNEDPTKRPSIDEVASRFDALETRLNWFQRRSPVIYRDDFILILPWKYTRHWSTMLWNTLRRKRTVPEAQT